MVKVDLMSLSKSFSFTIEILFGIGFEFATTNKIPQETSKEGMYAIIWTPHVVIPFDRFSKNQMTVSI